MGILCVVRRGEERPWRIGTRRWLTFKGIINRYVKVWISNVSNILFLGGLGV